MDKDKLESEIQAAVGAHGAWKMKLTAAINRGQSDTPLDDIGCDDKCAFGRWLHSSEIDSETKAGKPYQVTRRLHAEFHKAAHDVAALALEGRKGEAFRMMDGEYRDVSDKLLRALNKWRGEVRSS